MMSDESTGASGAEKGIELGREIAKLLGQGVPPVSYETLAKLKSIAPNEVLDRVAAARLTNEINRNQIEVIKAELISNIGTENFEKLKESVSSFIDDISKDVANDIEVMSNELVNRGFPDPRLNHDNWRIIAKMVLTDPDGFMEDIYEAAIAFSESEKRNEYLERERADGLSDDGLSLRWGGKLYPFKPTAARVIKVLFDSFLRGFPYLSEDYLKTECDAGTDMRHLVRDNELTEIVVREVGRGGKVVKGKWGLIDPKKLC